MEEMAAVDLPYPEADGKNLFLRDDKKRHYYLLTLRGDKRVDLKAFRQANGTRPLSFASAEDLQAKLGLLPGGGDPRWGPSMTGRARWRSFWTRTSWPRRGSSGSTPTTTPPPSGCGRRTSSPCCGTTAPWSMWCPCKGRWEAELCPIFLQGLTMGLAYVAPIGVQNLFVIHAALNQPRRRAWRRPWWWCFFDVSLALACFFGVGAVMEAFPAVGMVVLLVGSVIVLAIASVCFAPRSSRQSKRRRGPGPPVWPKRPPPPLWSPGATPRPSSTAP